MKRIIAFVLAALMMAAVFTACGGNKTDSGSNNDSSSAQEVDLKAVLNDINKQFGLEGLKSIDDASKFNRIFAVDEANIKQFAGEYSSAASTYLAIAIVEVTDASAIETVKGNLQAYLDSQLGDAKSYNADQVAMLEACGVKTTGNFVYLVISDKYNEITSAIEAALK